MAETSFPVAGGGGVVDYTYEKLMAPVTGAGFTGAATVSPVMYANSTGRQFKFAANRSALINGFRWETDPSGLTWPVAANTSGQPRLDLAVIRLDRNNWTARAAVRQGTPAATPVAAAWVQQDGPDGVFEIPCGVAKVVSTTSGEAAAGLPSLAPADVTPLDYYLAPQMYVAHSKRPPPAVHGVVWYQYDTGRTMRAVNDVWMVLGDSGPATALPAAGNWNDSSLFVQRRNGFVYLQGTIRRSGPTLPANGNSILTTIPDSHRPAVSLYLLAHFATASFARLFLDASTGQLRVTDYAVSLATGNYVAVHPATWPAK